VKYLRARRSRGSTLGWPLQDHPRAASSAVQLDTQFERLHQTSPDEFWVVVGNDHSVRATARGIRFEGKLRLDQQTERIIRMFDTRLVQCIIDLQSISLLNLLGVSKTVEIGAA
jgi:hypothetical protein